MARLCLLSDDGSTSQKWELGDQPVAVGRGEAADIIIPDESLSRLHFEIRREGTNYLIKDLHSQNGTFVDGELASNTLLHPSECIMAGRTIFVFTD